MNLRVPWNAGKFLSSCTIGGFSRRTQLHEWVIRYYQDNFDTRASILCISFSALTADSYTGTRNNEVGDAVAEAQRFTCPAHHNLTY
jgi:hypothetical protein